MKKPLLKILPGVAAILITPSCSKDNDIIAEDNAALVAEQVIAKKVFYVKINNDSSLKKMAIKDLGTAGNKTLKFEIGDELYIKFSIWVDIDDSGAIFENVKVVVKVPGRCISEDGVFEFISVNSYGDNLDGDNIVIEKTEYEPMNGWFCAYAVNEVLEEIEQGNLSALEEHNAEFIWGEQINFSDKKYHAYDDISEMMAAAPRKAVQSFTLKQDGDYCFIVFEDGTNKNVTIDGQTLNHSKYYIVQAGIDIIVEDGAETKTINTKSGRLYNVRK